ncbi:hypothetical protein DNAM5_116 [Haloarcula californiae tailed virus 1]|uniref:Uncharacterized protein n=1 Tax=Haloarcula californiae tailed virus 1 TaxID=1273746 RepID=R4TAL1_9CAUD|nr:hypothetical protein M202_gp103 [Haloarcula californiae tailed virus 1]AGM11975.1 hypothetical protein DNAM5_116 [Haloarcula californiae tailed virus 1]
MSLVDVILTELVSEFGVAVLGFGWLMYQVYSPDWLPETKLQKMMGSIEREIKETRGLLVSAITVLRAVVRTNDEVDTEKVDDYLVENGVEPDDFIDSTDMRGEEELGDD